jgi:hypothetical protein
LTKRRAQIAGSAQKGHQNPDFTNFFQMMVIVGKGSAVEPSGKSQGVETTFCCASYPSLPISLPPTSFGMIPGFPSPDQARLLREVPLFVIPSKMKTPRGGAYRANQAA